MKILDWSGAFGSSNMTSKNENMSQRSSGSHDDYLSVYLGFTADFILMVGTKDKIAYADLKKRKT
jgi:hypothetical protein